MDAESILILLLIGAIAGWLAGQIVEGYGFGLIGNIIVGILGALFGNWLLGQFGLTLGGTLLKNIISATIGASVLLFLLGLVRRSPPRV